MFLGKKKSLQPKKVVRDIYIERDSTSAGAGAAGAGAAGAGAAGAGAAGAGAGAMFKPFLDKVIAGTVNARTVNAGTENRTLISWSELLLTINNNKSLVDPIDELQAAISMLFMKGLGDWLQAYYIYEIGNMAGNENKLVLKTGDKLVVGDVITTSGNCMFGKINTASDLNDKLDIVLKINDLEKQRQYFNKTKIAPGLSSKFGIKGYNFTFLGSIFNTKLSLYEFITRGLFYIKHKDKTYLAFNKATKSIKPLADAAAAKKFLETWEAESGGASDNPIFIFCIQLY